MQKVPALRGRLSFSHCISKTFQIFPALSVNFKKGPWVDFFDDVSLFLHMWHFWLGLEDADSLKTSLKGQNCPSSNKDYEVADFESEMETKQHKNPHPKHQTMVSSLNLFTRCTLLLLHCYREQVIRKKIDLHCYIKQIVYWQASWL
jgi:hypothetical protein